MTIEYALGVAAAIIAGMLMETGYLMQKKAVNDVPQEVRETRFMGTLIRRPLWVAGIIVQYGMGSPGFIAAQALIGPALAPGLMASGLIVLAIGSVKFLGESLKRSEVIGVAVMITAITLLGMSKLGIHITVVQESIRSADTLIRMALFTVGLTAAGVLLFAAARRNEKRRGTLLALSTGIPYGIMNFWVSPLIAVIPIVFGVGDSAREIVILITAAIILILTNVLAVRQMQETFRFAQAANTIPLVKVPVQIAPILVYFYVFALQPPEKLSALLLISGAFLVIVSGFLLGRRQTLDK